MNLEQLKIERENISKNPNLTNKEKNSRIKIYQAFIESNNQELEYNEQMLQFIQNATQMVTISGGTYQVERTLEYNKMGLKGNILDSDFVKKLEEDGIDEFTLSDLKFLAYNYETQHGIDLTETKLAIQLYEQAEKIESLEKKQMEIISRNLGDLLGKSIVSDVNEKGIIQSDGKAIIKETAKSEEQLQEDYRKAISKIDELYVNEGIFDIKTKNICLQMLNQLFNYYKNGNKKVPMDIVEQLRIQNQQTEKEGKTI